jgi:Flp pilus assembly protein TadB
VLEPVDDLGTQCCLQMVMVMVMVIVMVMVMMVMVMVMVVVMVMVMIFGPRVVCRARQAGRGRQKTNLAKDKSTR